MHPLPTRVARFTILAVVAVLATATAPPAAADEFSDFRIPDHRTFGWTGSMFAGGGSHTFRRTSNAYDTWGGNGGLATAASGRIESDRHLTTYGISGMARGATNHSSQDLGPRPTLGGIEAISEEREERTAEEEWGVRLLHRLYPFRMPIGLGLSGSAAGRYLQRMSDERTEAWRQDSLTLQTVLGASEQKYREYLHTAQASGEVGVGRVRDATAVYEARVLEQRLQESGSLTRPLSPQARRRLVDVLYLRDTYAGVRERPAKFVWDAVEEVLVEDGALAGDHVAPEALLRGAEPALGPGRINDLGLYRSPVLRLTGWFVGAEALVFTHRSLYHQDLLRIIRQTFNGVPTPDVVVSYGTRVEDRYDLSGAGPVGEFHRPIGTTLQVDATASVNWVLRGPVDGFNGGGRVITTWIDADRWLAALDVGYQRQVLDRDDGRDYDDWYWVYSVTASRYLEDRLQLQARVTGSQTQAADPLSGDLFQRDLTATLALSWEFMGRMEAPGTYAPVRIGWGAP